MEPGWSVRFDFWTTSLDVWELPRATVTIPTRQTKKERVLEVALVAESSNAAGLCALPTVHSPFSCWFA